jgi:prepilin-type N-terminal cleavage/methylation domain-containing protein
MNKKGFTLVELMVVIVIIGVLAAVAIPKMMAATNKAKAGEGPQILRSIGSMEAVYKAEKDKYLTAPKTTLGAAVTAVNTPWGDLGFDLAPSSKYFTFEVKTAGIGDDQFTATAALGVTLGGAKTNDNITLNEKDDRKVSSKDLANLVPNWGEVAAAAGE